MIEITVGRIDPPTAPTVSPDSPVSEVAAKLRRTDTPAVVVLEDSAVVGVVTDSDIVAMVAETDAKPDVRSIMSAPAATVSPHATLVDAAATMRENGVKHLPVVDSVGCCGLLSAEELSPYLSRYQVDIEWQGEPLEVGATSASGVTAGD